MNIVLNPTPAFSCFFSCGASIKETLSTSATKVKDLVTSSWGQFFIGFGLGLGAHKVYMPITQKVLSGSIGTFVRASVVDPFRGMSLADKIALAPIVCIIGPIMEEFQFREFLQGGLKETFESFFQAIGLPDSLANLSARISAIFFTSIAFGLVHFSNALFFWCNPMLFLPQVVAATVMGVLFGLAKEITDGLEMPIGMHIGNNTLAWVMNIKSSL